MCFDASAQTLSTFTQRETSLRASRMVLTPSVAIVSAKSSALASTRFAASRSTVARA